VTKDLSHVASQPTVPFFAQRCGAVPVTGAPVIEGIQLPLGRRGPEEAPAYWISDESPEDLAATATALVTAFPTTGLWPLAWQWDRHEVTGYLHGTAVGGLGALPEPSDVFDRAWHAFVPWGRGPGGEPFPGLARGASWQSNPPGREAPFREVIDNPDRVEWRQRPRLLLVPCNRPADVLAITGWDFSAIPAPVLTAVFRSWEERFAAVPVALDPSGVSLFVGAAPDDDVQAARLAAEHYAIAGAGNDKAALAAWAERLRAPSTIPDGGGYSDISATRWVLAPHEVSAPSVDELVSQAR
jgi:hypothetical protein